MALSTYADVSTAIANELHRSDLTSYIPDFIRRAEAKINKLRIRQMETTTASTMSAGVIAVPSNYIELKDAYISSLVPYVNLDRKTSNWIYDKYPTRQADSVPRFIAREGTNFIFGPYPAANYVVTMVFYNRFAPLSDSTNALFSIYPGLWLYGALLEAEGFLKNDKRVPLWQEKFVELMKMAQDDDNDEYLSGAVPSVVAG